MPDIRAGAELVLELTGGTQRPVRVCWVSPSELGLQVIDRQNK